LRHGVYQRSSTEFRISAARVPAGCAPDVMATPLLSRDDHIIILYVTVQFIGPQCCNILHIISMPAVFLPRCRANSPQPKRHLDRFSRYCTDDRGVSLLFTVVCLFPTQNYPLPMLESRPHVIRGSLGPPESGTQMVT